MKISYQIKDNYLLFSYINKIPKDLIEGNFYREGAIKYTKKYLKSIENDENYKNVRYVYLGTFNSIEENLLYNEEDFDNYDYKYYGALQDFERSLNHSEFRFVEDEYYIMYITDDKGEITIHNITSTEIAEEDDYNLEYCMELEDLYWKFTENSTMDDEWAYKNGECIISIGVDSNSNNIEVLVDAFYNPHTSDFEIKNIDMVYTNVSVVEEIHTKEQLDLFMENNEISNFIPLVYDEKDLLKFYQLLFYKLLE